MTPVKKTTKKAEAAVTEEVKAAVEAPKAEEKKAPAKKPAAKKTVKQAAEVVKEETKKAAEAVKEETKKVTKKAAAAAKKVSAPDASVYVEFYGKQIAAKNVLEQALNAYKANHKDAVKSIEIYVKPEENAAYYVVNGQGSDDFKIEL